MGAPLEGVSEMIQKIPRLTQHGSEIFLLGLIAAGVVWLLGKIIEKGGDGYDLAAFLLVLQAIVTAIKDRWQQRSVDRMGDQLAGSMPSEIKPSKNVHVPQSAIEGAEEVKEAAVDKFEELKS